MGRYRVSDLSVYKKCPIRSKLLALGKVPSVTGGTRAKEEGIKRHKAYSVLYPSYYKDQLRKDVPFMDKIFERWLGDDLIVGCIDNVRVLPVYNGQKILRLEVALIEFKTTTKKWIPKIDREVAKDQLRIYLWLVGPEFRKAGWTLRKRHWVEWYSQSPNRLKFRESVCEDPKIESDLARRLDSFYGQAPIGHPLMMGEREAQKICNTCPKEIKEGCTFYKYIKKKGR